MRKWLFKRSHTPYDVAAAVVGTVVWQETNILVGAIAMVILAAIGAYYE